MKGLQAEEKGVKQTNFLLCKQTGFNMIQMGVNY